MTASLPSALLTATAIKSRPRLKRAKMQEQQLHKAVYELLSAILTPETFATTFPAGGGGAVRGAILKSIGLKAGVPDWLIVHEGHAHFIELKAPNGVLSKEQVLCHADINRACGNVTVARSLNDVVEALTRWRIPTRIAKHA